MASPRHLASPDAYDFKPAAWEGWIRRFNRYRSASKLALENEQVQIDTLIYCLSPGTKGEEVFSALIFDTDKSPDKYDDVVEALRNHFVAKRNIVYERACFYKRDQMGDETAESYITSLWTLAASCNFPANFKEEAIRDRLVVGMKDKKLSEHLQFDAELTLQTVVNKLKHSEAVKAQQPLLAESAHTSQHQSQSQRIDEAGLQRGSTHKRQRPGGTTGECGNCGLGHRPRQCPAYGQVCKICSKKNHWARKCRSSRQRNTNEVHCEATSSDSEAYGFDEIGGTDARDQHAIITIGTPNGPKLLKGKVDTGAQTNLLNHNTYTYLFGKGKLRSTTIKLHGYGGRELYNYGEVPVVAQHNGHKIDTKFYVTDQGNNLFGLQLCKALNIVRMVCDTGDCGDCSGHYDISELSSPSQVFIDSYPDVFDGIGCCLDRPYKISLSGDAIPTVIPARKVPESLKVPLRHELDRLQRLDIIKKVTEPTEWVNSIVLVTKTNGDLRICLDPRNLNKYIMRPHYYLKTLDDVLPSLKESKYFTTLDVRSGYWNIPLHQDCQHMTTFNTVYGRYCFQRLAFGLSSSQDIFQREMDQIFGEIPNVYCIADDILVATQTRSEHDKALRDVVNACRSSGIKLNGDKCNVLRDNVKLFGHILDKNGISADPSKVKAIKNLQAPSNKQEVMSLLGLINYLSRFVQLSQLTEPIRKLIQKDVIFEWTPAHDAALTAIKDKISRAPTLAYFNATENITIQCDASMKGLGAVLMQNGKPVHFASKSLTSAETNYSNIERELLAVVWATKYFKTYVYGRQFTINTDHQPLESIQKKEIAKMPARLQRLMLQLQEYNGKIIYVPGKDVPVADCLSRCIDTRGKTYNILYSHIIVFYIH